MSTGTRNIDEIAVAVSGDVYIAPVGVPLPALVRETLHPSFYKIGLVSEDGIAVSWSPEIAEFRAMQEQQPVRRELSQQRIALTFDMLQWNAETVVWAFGGRGMVVEYAPGQWRYDFPSSEDTATDDRSIVVDWEDGPKRFRFVFYKGTVLDGLTTTLSRGALATLPVGFDVLGYDASGSPGYLFLSAHTAETPPDPPPEGTPSFGEGDFGDGDFGG